MDNLVETKGGPGFTDRETWVDLQAGQVNSPDAAYELTDPSRHADTHPDSIDHLEALRRDSDERNPSLDLTKGFERDPAQSGGGPRFKRTTKQFVLVALLVLAAGIIAPFVWDYLQSYESTDDAQIDGHIDAISSRIDGTVIRVHVEDDDRVKKGELLVEIDPRDYEVAVERAKAELELALAQVDSAKQGYAAALAKVREDVAANYRAQRDAGRYAILFEKQVVPQEQYDQYTATARVDAATVDSDREAASSTLKAIAARQAEADAAKAALDQTLLNLSYTKIYAPVSGVVGHKTVELGHRVQPGQTLLTVVPVDDIWITANFKESQLRHMRPGQPVTVHVDAFGRDYEGKVEDMAGAAGPLFSLFPPENASGNYVKIVQRFPIRIHIDANQDSQHELRPGMSVEAKVRVR